MPDFYSSSNYSSSPKGKVTVTFPLVSVLFLGLSSGLPFALSGSTLQAWYASENINILTISLLSLVTQPYIYKFLWAPFLDRYIPPFLGRRRGWIMLMQASLVFMLILMALIGSPKHHPLLLAFCALLLSIFSATQDIAIDAYRTDIIKPAGYGTASAYYISVYRLALILSGGFALIIADHYGWKSAYLLMAFLMAGMMLMTALSPEPKRNSNPASVKKILFKQLLLIPLQEFLSRPFAKWTLLFLFFYKFGDAFTLSLSTVFLIKYLHYSLSIVGSANKIIGVFSAIMGGLAGGWLYNKLGLYRALFYFSIGQALCSFLFMLLAITGQNLFLLLLTVFADNFLGGMSSVALLAFITSLCHQEFSAAQFAFFSAVTSLPRVFIGPIAALTINMIGWTKFFFISFFMSIPSLWLLWSVRNSYDAFYTKFQEQ